LADVGHVRHGTAGVAVWQHHNLMFPAQDVGAFGHEVDATENEIAPHSWLDFRHVNGRRGFARDDTPRS
jgi:hypothetical protein